MLYFILYDQLFRYVKAFNVFRYVTFRTAMASLTALFLCVALGPWLIGKLREFQIGQYIREEGPKSHQKKAGTPTMGGVLIIISIVVPTLLWADLRYPYVWIAVAALVAFGWIGFLDDYAKVTQRRNLGLTARRKLVYQFGAGFAFAAILLLMRSYGDYSHGDEFPVLQTVQAVATVAGSDGEPVDLAAGRRAVLHLRRPGGGVFLERGESDGRAGRPGHRSHGGGGRRVSPCSPTPADTWSWPRTSSSRATRTPSELTIFCGSMTAREPGFPLV